MNDHITPIAICWHCDHLLDGAATMAEEDYEPAPNMLSFCLYCGTLSVFDDALILRPPTREMLAELAEDEDFRQIFVGFQWARQQVLLEHKLMGHEGADN